MQLSGIKTQQIKKVENGRLAFSREDHLAVEEPLEIRLCYGESRKIQSVSITMRTPGNDFELAVGFLLAENILKKKADLEKVSFCGASANIVRVDLKPHVAVNLERLERHSFTSSSCGMCGKKSLEQIGFSANVTAGEPVRAEVIHSLPKKIRDHQAVFSTTGGLHASAIFSAKGDLQKCFEDVGRHNALDKVIGSAFLDDLLPLKDSILLVSGRASYELVQKAAQAGIPLVAAVGAPSSLAVELAQECGITILGFVREDRFNIYCGDGIFHEA